MRITETSVGLRTSHGVDCSLHARIRAGDPEAFREIFLSHAQMVYRHALRITGDWALAEDVVSLTFLEAWRLRGRLRDEGDSPRPWLMGIATNVLRNTVRARRRHERAMARLPARQTVPDFADELIGRIGDAEQLFAAQAGLARLRQCERDVFTLCVWSGLSYQEAAQALGVPTGTVRSRLARARARLRKLAQEELKNKQAEREKAEPGSGSGQVQGGRTEAARSSQERNR
ncbi:RNA polymerase sigma factor [Actinacidiphila acidipaludis]|uniref:RNA polymerase sigma factor n=1 Tax=Actinacidiphila acidipaludis TaxID=2873382 RepID=A0ABS7QL17_9ACTN|nr:RNA polymerase sigma factor [Streptomyces acidipaludis]MBY8882587.1 RNA polymerase sigma factor [Streptomyces acidipaludis]